MSAKILVQAQHPYRYTKKNGKLIPRKIKWSIACSGEALTVKKHTAPVSLSLNTRDKKQGHRRSDGMRGHCLVATGPSIQPSLLMMEPIGNDRQIYLCHLFDVDTYLARGEDGNEDGEDEAIEGAAGDQDEEE